MTSRHTQRHLGRADLAEFTRPDRGISEVHAHEQQVGAEASWFAIPKLVPVKIVFDLRAILPVMIMFIVTAVETVGDISGVMEGGTQVSPPIRS